MSYYDILEVSPKASKEVIKNAYRALSKKYHPDTYKGDLKYAQEKMKEINTAYETLIDEEKRLNYDYENGFKIDPNAIVEEFKEAVESQEEYVEEKEAKKDIFQILKEKKGLTIVGICAVFVIAVLIGNLLAGAGDKKEQKQETKKPSTTINLTNNKKECRNNSYTKPQENLTNNVNNDKKEENTQPKVEEKKEEQKVEEITPQEPAGES